MTAETIESPVWPARRWLGMIILIMLGQVGLIFWLARHQPAPVRPEITGSTVFLGDNDIMDKFGLSNPAQFVLPNQNGFSGGAWLQTMALAYDSPQWTEPPRPLALAVDKLGSGLVDFAQTNLTYTFELTTAPEPQLDPIVPLPPLPTESWLSVEGELAGRLLLSKFKIESWPAAEILSNSVVQVGVNREGAVFSAVLLGGAKDSKEGKAADASALNLAGSARFQPLPRGDFDHPDGADKALQWGRLVFHWHTIAPPPTNSTAAN